MGAGALRTTTVQQAQTCVDATFQPLSTAVSRLPDATVQALNVAAAQLVL